MKDLSSRKKEVLRGRKINRPPKGKNMGDASGEKKGKCPRGEKTLPRKGPEIRREKVANTLGEGERREEESNQWERRPAKKKASWKEGVVKKKSLDKQSSPEGKGETR